MCNILKRYGAGLVCCGVIAIAAGCATVRYQSIPPTETASNEYFEARLTPVLKYHGAPYWGAAGFESFELEIENKTEGNIELDWNRTLFIDDTQNPVAIFGHPPQAMF